MARSKQQEAQKRGKNYAVFYETEVCWRDGPWGKKSENLNGADKPICEGAKKRSASTSKASEKRKKRLEIRKTKKPERRG